MQTFLRKNLDRICYLCLLISLNSAYCLIKLLTYFHFLIPRSKNKKDLILFPYTQKGSDGYTRRFEEYFYYFKKENISFYVADLCDQEYVYKCENGSVRQRYWLYIFVIWNRLFQVLKARNYKTAFIHRGLFPFYPDQSRAFLEPLLRKLNKNIIVDYFDSVYMYYPILTRDIIKNANKITVVNEYLKDNFYSVNHDSVYIWPMAVNINKYKVKTCYDIKGTIKLIWTGYPDNMYNELPYLAKILKNITKDYPVELILVCRETMKIENVKVTQHLWEENTFFKILNEADIGIYPVEHNEYSRGKMAMKVIDYMATGLPTIVSPYGIPPNCFDKQNVLIAKDEQNWEKCIRELIHDKELRKKLGYNAKIMINQHHSLDSSFIQFKKIISDSHFIKEKDTTSIQNTSKFLIKSRIIKIIDKNIDRLFYLYLIIALRIGYIIATLFTNFSFILPKKRKKDLLLFPYYPKDSMGDILRFKVYLKFFTQDNITYDIDYIGENNHHFIPGYFNGPINIRKSYINYVKIFRKRLWVVLKAGNYKAVFIQRALFPFFPDQYFPYLNRLIRKLNNNITIDFYDSDYTGNRNPIHLSLRYCNKVTVVNSYLKNYFIKLHKDVRIMPLTLNHENYIVKKDYRINGDIKIFWTGSSENTVLLYNLLPVLSELASDFAIKLILVTPIKISLGNINCSCYTYDKDTFFKLLNSANIAISPKQDSERHRGGMAMKCLEYMASALPFVASPWNISPHLINKEDVLTATTHQEWKECLEELIKSEPLRKKIGTNGYNKFIQYHHQADSYKIFKEIIFDKQTEIKS